MLFWIMDFREENTSMEDNKRDYSDFFNGASNDSRDSNPNTDTDKQEKSSYYYSYGPYKSGMSEQASSETTVSSEGETSKVEITSPRPVRQMFAYEDQLEQSK